MTYVIHGATGSQGAPVVAALVRKGMQATALTRRSDAVVEGAEVHTVDVASIPDLTEAYRGAEGVFAHLPVASAEQQFEYAHSIVVAAKEAKPARVVFSTSGAPIDAPGSPAAIVVQGLADSGVPYAVIEPTFYLENLLAPYSAPAARESGMLRYPIRSDMPVSWASHLDIAEVAVALFERPEMTGTVGVGQWPGITGHDLAAALGARLGRKVAFHLLPPAELRIALTPLLGEGPAAGVAGMYEGLLDVPNKEIDAERSAQKLLSLTPLTPHEWLDKIGF